MGNGSVITAGEVQVMSAGSGIMHSEFNPSPNKEVNLFQIWIFPDINDAEPRYDQRRYEASSFNNTIKTVVNNSENDNSLFIHQKAVISLSKPSAKKELLYELHYPGNGVYMLVIDGKIEVDGTILLKRDALGVTDLKDFSLKAHTNSFILILEVPMN
jgi:redox-sensitive bicupin YhaK (pirin superfamily)